MEIKQGLKKTKIGWIPMDWEVKQIKELSKITAGGTPSTLRREYWGGNIPWMSSGELNLKKVYNVIGRITDIGLKNSSTKSIPKKSVLIGLAGQGKTRGTVAMNMIDLCTNQSIGAILPSELFIPEFLFYNLESRYHEIRRMSTGDGGRGGLNLKIIGSIKVPFPIKIEQQKIAEILSTWDKGIESSQNLIEQLKLRKKGLMQQLLTGEKRLSGFSREWQEVKLGSIIEEFKLKNKIENQYEVLTSSRKGLVLQKDYFGENRITDRSNLGFNIIPNNYITYRSRSDNGTFKFNLNNLGFTGVISNYYPVFKMKNECNKFFIELSDFFNHHIGRYSVGTSQVVLAMSALKKIKFKIPSDEEQKAIENISIKADEEISQQEKYFRHLQSQKKGLMQQLLTGKKRVTLN